MTEGMRFIPKATENAAENQVATDTRGLENLRRRNRKFYKERDGA